MKLYPGDRVTFNKDHQWHPRMQAYPAIVIKERDPECYFLRIEGKDDPDCELQKFLGKHLDVDGGFQIECWTGFFTFEESMQIEIDVSYLI